jgi:hypothetical protein
MTRLAAQQAEKMQRIRVFGMCSKDLLVQRLRFREPALPVMRERGFEPLFAIGHGVPMIEGRWTLARDTAVPASVKRRRDRAA